MVGIVGSGFGLYGYLPAIIMSTNEQVFLLKKSLGIFERRTELQFCKERITWFEKEEDFYINIKTLILCVPPTVQFKILKKIGSLTNIERIILEKPVSTNPKKSSFLLDLLEKQNKKIIIGYSFQYTDWANDLIKIIKNTDRKIEHISINWSFKAFHYKNGLENWKRYRNMGGGVLRFFGIHIIALLSNFGYSDVIESKTNSYTNEDSFLWSALFIGNNLPTISVCVDSNSSEESFFIEGYLLDKNKLTIKQLLHPFEINSTIKNTNEKMDVRVEILMKLINELFKIKSPSEYYRAYNKVNDLWKKVEKINLNSII